MVDAKRLLADLKRLHRSLQADLREQHDASVQRDAVQAEWRTAFDAKRTADTFETFWSGAIDQAAVHWILGVVFLRFLEDNRLLDRPFLSGPGERLDLALERQRAYVRGQPLNTDTDYLLDTFADAARLPGLAGLYGSAHNPLFRLPLSGDGAIALLAFFRNRVPDTGELVHDFTDPAWNTRFLGDLYQDLSEEARKRYALLQTPEFVEEWILDRTLDPAMREFGATKVRMIDPACGSGHFLLGGFFRVLAAWQREEPEMPPAAQAQRALDAVSGVDLNPFAVEIARFRLLLAALLAAEVTRLTAAPAFRFSLAVGDSLLHGRHFGRQQRDLVEVADEGFRRTLRHHYATEDTGELDAILGRQYQAVVGNPPYITPKDAAMREAYREIYVSCYMKYALAVPFIERFFDIAQTGDRDRAAGYLGLIVSNSFMKREFGKKLIEEVLPQLDLTHVVDCSGAYIPGHGTPTAILFGRNRAPIGNVVRTVRGIRGEPTAPEDPRSGLVWLAIMAQMDRVGSVSNFVSAEDTIRAALARHPWNMGGGGAAEVQEVIEGNWQRLASIATSVGVMAVTGEDEVFSRPRANDFRRIGGAALRVRVLVEGDVVRDWRLIRQPSVLFPYTTDFEPQGDPSILRLLWRHRTTVAAYVCFGKTRAERHMALSEYGMLVKQNSDARPSITFGEVATHNNFVLGHGDKVFNRTAPVIKLATGASEDDHLGLVGLLNSSTACFWLKQTCHNKGRQGINEGAKAEPWERFIQINATRLEAFPVSMEQPLDLACALNTEARRLTNNIPATICVRAVPTLEVLDTARQAAQATRATMITLQEELDWSCYRLYRLLDHSPEHESPPPLRLGERAFEIVMARRIAAGELETTWFTRHGSTPITELPQQWPADYRAIVERRIELIETDPTIGLIERPEYKRRWSTEPWETLERDALRDWLLDRLEDARNWSRTEPRLISTRALADAVRADADFISVAALYADDTAFNLEVLIAELVAREAVPFLAPLRYSETGLRKRADWEATWDKQRQEDAIDADVTREQWRHRRERWAQDNPHQDGEINAAYQARMQTALADATITAPVQSAIDRIARERKQQEVGPIPVPPKYRTPDFLSADFWRLRGSLDVQKERFVSFPHCARDADGSLPVLWAGYDHLARAQAIAAWYVERKDTDGWPAPRLIPLLAGLLELVPWLRQWHNDIDPATGLRMGDYFTDFIDDECRTLGLNLADLREWKPPAPTRRPRGRRAAA